MMDPIVIDPAEFSQQAAWDECRQYVEDCGGLAHDDGEPNWRAAFGADPGVCSCPACGEMYWAWGRKQRCVKCAFEYPTDWWSMYSWGCQAVGRPQFRYKHNERMQHPYYRYGFLHPVSDPWKEHDKPEWRTTIREVMMSINAIVKTVYHNEDGSGRLSLEGEERGQDVLHFDTAPHDVTALNGRQIWGGANSILYGEVELAKRDGYTRIVFTVESVSKAIAQGDKIRESRV